MNEIAKICKVTRGGMKMKGVVASRDLPRGTYIGTYQGDVVPLITIDEWILAYQVTFGTTYKTASNKMLMYGLESHASDEYIYLPTDRFGNIKRKYKDCLSLYVNEPGPGESYNIVWVINETNDKVYFFTSDHILKGQELLTTYGDVYNRNYPITDEAPPYSLKIEEIHLIHN